jgi:hypothetical protein
VERGFEHTIEISAQPHTVWDALTRFDAYPVWNPFLAVEGVPVVGAPLRIRLTPARGRQWVVSPHVVEAVPDERLRWAGRLPLGLFSGEHGYVIERLPEGGVRVTHRGGYRGLLVRVLGGVIDQTSSGFERMQRALKAYAEGLPAQPAAGQPGWFADVLAAARLRLDQTISAAERADANAAARHAREACQILDIACRRPTAGGLGGVIGEITAGYGFGEAQLELQLDQAGAPPAVELLLCETAQRLLQAASKRAAGRVWVTLACAAGQAQLSVEDDGEALGAVRFDDGGRGLRLLARRVHAAGGRMTADTHDGRTRIRVRVPTADTPAGR